MTPVMPMPMMPMATTAMIAPAPISTTPSISGPMSTPTPISIRTTVSLSLLFLPTAPAQLILNNIRSDSAHSTAQQRPQLSLAKLMPYQPAGAAPQQRRPEAPLAVRSLAIAAVRVAIVRVCGMRAWKGR